MPVLLDGDGYGPPTARDRECQMLAKMTFAQRKAYRITKFTRHKETTDAK